MSKTKKLYDVIIIGSGPAGYSAALYASRANLTTLLIGGPVSGGQLMLTSEVENYPGFKDGILGPELISEMRAQAQRFGTEYIDELVTKVELKNGPKKVWVDDQLLQARSVIIATGAQANWLGLDNEKKLMGKGISACATCDGYFFKNKHVVVVGGGDTAMEEALTLTKFADKVTVVHRRDKLRASKIMQERAFKHQKINFIWNTTVVDVLGDTFVDGVVTESILDHSRQTINCQGLFVAIGYTPSTKLFRGLLDMDKKGYLLAKNGVFTGVEGVFAAGDVADSRYRQAVTAAGDGCRAALEVEHFLTGL